MELDKIRRATDDICNHFLEMELRLVNLFREELPNLQRVFDKVSKDDLRNIVTKKIDHHYREGGDLFSGIDDFLEEFLSFDSKVKFPENCESMREEKASGDIDKRNNGKKILLRNFELNCLLRSILLAIYDKLIELGESKDRVEKLDNLIFLRKKKNLSLRDLANMSGLNAQAINRFELGLSSQHTFETLKKLSQSLNCSPVDLLPKSLLGSEYLSVDTNKNDIVETVKKDEYDITVPFYDISASAGHGCPMEELSNNKEIINFDSRFINHTIHNKKELVMLKVAGDSMYPTLNNRDYLLVDRSMSDVKALGSGVYIISEDNALKVKRLIYNSYDKSIKVVSDNISEVGGIREYPNYEINADNHSDNFRIVGRSIWNGRKF